MSLIAFYEGNSVFEINLCNEDGILKLKFPFELQPLLTSNLNCLSKIE